MYRARKLLPGGTATYFFFDSVRNERKEPRGGDAVAAAAAADATAAEERAAEVAAAAERAAATAGGGYDSDPDEQLEEQAAADAFVGAVNAVAALSEQQIDEQQLAAMADQQRSSMPLVACMVDRFKDKPTDTVAVVPEDAENSVTATVKELNAEKPNSTVGAACDSDLTTFHPVGLSILQATLGSACLDEAQVHDVPAVCSALGKETLVLETLRVAARTYGDSLPRLVELATAVDRGGSFSVGQLVIYILCLLDGDYLAHRLDLPKGCGSKKLSALALWLACIVMAKLRQSCPDAEVLPPASVVRVLVEAMAACDDLCTYKNPATGPDHVLTITAAHIYRACVAARGRQHLVVGFLVPRFPAEDVSAWGTLDFVPLDDIRARLCSEPSILAAIERYHGSFDRLESLVDTELGAPLQSLSEPNQDKLRELVSRRSALEAFWAARDGRAVEATPHAERVVPAGRTFDGFWHPPMRLPAVRSGATVLQVAASEHATLTVGARKLQQYLEICSPVGLRSRVGVTGRVRVDGFLKLQLDVSFKKRDAIVLADLQQMTFTVLVAVPGRKDVWEVAFCKRLLDMLRHCKAGGWSDTPAERAVGKFIAGGGGPYAHGSTYWAGWSADDSRTRQASIGAVELALNKQIPPDLDRLLASAGREGWDDRRTTVLTPEEWELRVEPTVAVEPLPKGTLVMTPGLDDDARPAATEALKGELAARVALAEAAARTQAAEEAAKAQQEAAELAQRVASAAGGRAVEIAARMPGTEPIRKVSKRAAELKTIGKERAWTPEEAEDHAVCVRAMESVKRIRKECGAAGDADANDVVIAALVKLHAQVA